VSKVKDDTATALDLAKKVLRIEAAAILSLVDRLNGDFERAVDLLYECRGRVIVTGMGKSGIISRKIAATLSSTGTPAFFLHPAEAIHGDLGAIREDDVVVALSHSGETEELIRLLESIRRIGAKLIAITGSPASTLGRAADVTLDCGIAKEACPMNLVPTASTTASLALGDALAMTLLVRKGFREEQFAAYHPGGKLGKKLMTADDVMTPRALTVTRGMLAVEALRVMETHKITSVVVVDAEGRVDGVVHLHDLWRTQMI
jgi:arabinose-5-phosphate isomerase